MPPARRGGRGRRPACRVARSVVSRVRPDAGRGRRRRRLHHSRPEEQLLDHWGVPALTRQLIPRRLNGQQAGSSEPTVPRATRSPVRTQGNGWSLIPVDIGGLDAAVTETVRLRLCERLTRKPAWGKRRGRDLNPRDACTPNGFRDRLETAICRAVSGGAPVRSPVPSGCWVIWQIRTVDSLLTIEVSACCRGSEEGRLPPRFPCIYPVFSAFTPSSKLLSGPGSP